MANAWMKAHPKGALYSEEDVQAACQAVRDQKKSLREAARLHGVPPSTLKDRLRGRKPIHEVKRTVISPSEEERIVEWIKESTRRGFDCTVSHVQQAVQSILNNRKAETVFTDNLPGKKWVILFQRRHPDVVLKTPHELGIRRASVTENKLRAWFETALSEIQAAGGDILDHPSRIFHCDESGFQLGCYHFSKVLANRGDRHVYQVSETQPQITVMACASATGEVHNPLIIFPGQRYSYNPLEGFPEAHFARSNNGWIDGDIFSAWLKTAFIPAIKHLNKPVLLFAGGHRTHLTSAVCELCRDHGIILYQLPSHSSHIVQPLHLTTFMFLKEFWREEVLKFYEENGKIVGKREFSAVFKKAWKHGIQKDDVISGFRAAGLYPWNPDCVDMTKLEPPKLYLTETSATESVSSTNTMKPSEITGLAPGATETLIMTMAADESKINVHEVQPIDPPSPSAYPCAMPPLSGSSSLPSCATIATSSSSSSHIDSSSSSSSLIDNASAKETLDRLLDLAAKVGLDGLVRFRTLHSLGIETDDPDERLFCFLYSKLIRLLQNDNSGYVNNLPLPSCWTQKRKHTMIDSDVSGESVADVDIKKKKNEDEKQEEENGRGEEVETKSEREQNTTMEKEEERRTEEGKESQKETAWFKWSPLNT